MLLSCEGVESEGGPRRTMYKGNRVLMGQGRSRVNKQAEVVIQNITYEVQKGGGRRVVGEDTELGSKPEIHIYDITQTPLTINNEQGKTDTGRGSTTV